MTTDLSSPSTASNQLRTLRVAPLLFGSGMCSLVYQVVWFRELRLVFGASTAATAAVLAVFVGGLGSGGLVLGKRADADASPLGLYAKLETGIAVSAAITPALVWAVRHAYFLTGGAAVIGAAGSTVVRLLLSALVLGVPTFLMGGTLPAAARSVESDHDAGRNATAVLYAVNTLGAVTGCLLTNFASLELFGAKVTLWIATLVNLLVALTARTLARRSQPIVSTPADSPVAEPSPDLPFVAPFVLGAAGVVGFVFFLMELVWYRMLGPILGGTVFTFGLILAVALLGIGVGGGIYAARRSRPATLAGFALTCLIEAACMAVPYALGDRIAVLTLALRQLGAYGFAGHVLGWTAVTLVVVFPAALVSGIQFPMLIALLGRGKDHVGKQTGLAYAFNTVGAIAGSLGGGFGLMPALSAPGCWRASVWLLAALGVAALVLSWRRDRQPIATGLAAVVAALIVPMALSRGPTAAWRHSPIGVGRADDLRLGSPQVLRAWLNEKRRAIRWEADGVESSVAIDTAAGTAFVVNGKIDGNVRIDAATQVMAGLLGAALLANPKNAMVIGLGTGSTAGWLAAVPTIDRVDVVELEPAILEVARASNDVNQRVLENPKVHLSIGDAREALLTSRQRYDIVFSEPSNPYRAGIASLFTREYYEAIRERLTSGGVFLQWVQAYDIDSDTLASVYATLRSTFQSVETWELADEDLLLIARTGPAPVYDAATLRARIHEEPLRAALLETWRTNDLEGFLAHYVANDALATTISSGSQQLINTDDQTFIEFGFARSVGLVKQPQGEQVRKLARASGQSRPQIEGPVDWARVDDEIVLFATASGIATAAPDGPEDARARWAAQQAYLDGHASDAVRAWSSQPRAPASLTELEVVADSLADRGNADAQPHIDRLRDLDPTEADAIEARLLWRQGKQAPALLSMVSAFMRYRQDPWPSLRVMQRALAVTEEIARANPIAARRIIDVLIEPFCERMLDEARMQALFRLSLQADLGPKCTEVLDRVEPNVFWRKDVLAWRAACYDKTHDARGAVADQELIELLSNETPPFGYGLEKPAGNDAHATR